MLLTSQIRLFQNLDNLISSLKNSLESIIAFIRLRNNQISKALSLEIPVSLDRRLTFPLFVFQKLVNKIILLEIVRSGRSHRSSVVESSTSNHETVIKTGS